MKIVVKPGGCNSLSSVTRLGLIVSGDGFFCGAFGGVNA